MEGGDERNEANPIDKAGGNGEKKRLKTLQSNDDH
jgi:hypothetical protein